MTFDAIDQMAVSTIRSLSIEAIQAANSGHPGLPMGAAPMAYVLWNHVMNVNPKTSRNWTNRDRFVLSAGHGSALLYSLLHLSGYDVTMDDLKNFRQWGSKTPGHPEVNHTDGVEATSGPLGQGIANAEVWQWLKHTWQLNLTNLVLILLTIILMPSMAMVV